MNELEYERIWCGKLALYVKFELLFFLKAEVV